MELINNALAAFENFLAHASLVAILLGLVISLAGTQFVKGMLPNRNRWVIRSIGLPLGFIPTASLWPAEQPGAWAWGLAVGLGAPWLYKLVMAVLYWKWPALEAKLSAKPRAP